MKLLGRIGCLLLAVLLLNLPVQALPAVRLER
jgi:hypothetical protein